MLILNTARRALREPSRLHGGLLPRQREDARSRRTFRSSARAQSASQSHRPRAAGRGNDAAPDAPRPRQLDQHVAQRSGVPAPDPEHAPRNLPFSAAPTSARRRHHLARHAAQARAARPDDLLTYGVFGIVRRLADHLRASCRPTTVAPKRRSVCRPASPSRRRSNQRSASYAPDYQYPLDSIPSTMVDRFADAGDTRKACRSRTRAAAIRICASLTPASAATRSRIRDARDARAGSTSCIPDLSGAGEVDATSAAQPRRRTTTGHATVIDQAVVLPRAGRRRRARVRRRVSVVVDA